MQPLPYACITQVHRSTETTFDLVLTRPLSGVILPGTVLQDTATHREEPGTQCSTSALPCQSFATRSTVF